MRLEVLDFIGKIYSFTISCRGAKSYTGPSNQLVLPLVDLHLYSYLISTTLLDLHYAPEVQKHH